MFKNFLFLILSHSPDQSAFHIFFDYLPYLTFPGPCLLTPFLSFFLTYILSAYPKRFLTIFLIPFFPHPFVQLNSWLFLWGPCFPTRACTELNSRTKHAGTFARRHLGSSHTFLVEMLSFSRQVLRVSRRPLGITLRKCLATEAAESGPAMAFTFGSPSEVSFLPCDQTSPARDRPL